MATTATRFECQIPITGDTTQQTAIDTFITNLQSLTSVISTFQYVGEQYTMLVYGILTPAQNSTALGYLNTLNQSMPTPILCIAWSVTTEP